MDIDFFIKVFTDFEVGGQFDGFAVLDLCEGVFYGTVFDDGPVAHDLEVTFFGIYDDVEVVIRSVFLAEEGLEDVFQHFHEGGPVDILRFLEVLE